MNHAQVGFLVFWVLGAFIGVLVYALEGEGDKKIYARMLFWPLFLLIWIAGGFLGALREDLGPKKASRSE